MTAEFFELAQTLAEQARTAWIGVFAVFLRMGAAVALLPAFGEQVVPMRIRVAAALCFTAVVAPAVLPQVAAAAQGPGAVPRMFATEAVAGLALGIGLRLMVIALQVAGTIAAQSTSLSQFFGGAGVDPQPAIAQLLLVAGLALAAMAGLHVRLAEAAIASYALLPPGRFAPASALAEWGVAEVAHAFALAFSLAMPFVIAALIYNIALGAINRAMPQLMVAFVGAPALTLGGLFLLFLVAPVALALWWQAFDARLGDPFLAAEVAP
jgi:flagellar biosynthetic protein FliR